MTARCFHKQHDRMQDGKPVNAAIEQTAAAEERRFGCPGFASLSPVVRTGDWVRPSQAMLHVTTCHPDGVSTTRVNITLPGNA